MRYCNIEDCNKIHKGFGYCDKHYRNFKKNGNPIAETIYGDDRKRFESKVTKTKDCWLWEGSLDRDGYGIFTVKGEQKAHRYSYTTHKDSIPKGMHIDHLCRNRKCVNPEHLEVVTCKENLMRSNLTWASINSKKTHCPKQHTYSKSNTSLNKNGGRVCILCRRRAWREWSERKKLLLKYKETC